MEIKQAARRYDDHSVQGIYTRHRGKAASLNVYRRNAKPYQAISEDLSRKSSNHGPKNSYVITPKAQKQEDKVCKYWISGHCARGNKCWYLHSWCHGDGFTMLAKLEGHKKVVIVRNLGYNQNEESYIILSNISCFSLLQAVRGIALPLGSEKLYSASGDGTLRTWDCHSGQCACLSNLGDEVGSMITEGPWVFVGMKDVIEAWNTQTAQELSLKGPVGQVHSMVIANNMLFAGAQNGFIFAWKGSSEVANPFQLVASMEGHSGAVLCLTVGEKKLYSGSVDHTIGVWDTDTLQCIKTLNGHEDAVTSLLHCNGCLFSCSLDCSIKVWFATVGENWEVIYTHKEENGVLALCGMNDAETKPVLFCSCNDNTVRLYDLPSFTERGRLYSKREVRVIHRGPFPLFFTGDGSGSITVWKWL